MERTAEQLQAINDLCAALVAARESGNDTRELWRQLRHATGNKRERGGIYGHTSTGKAMAKQASDTALAVIALAAVVRPNEEFPAPGATWSGSWPRTVAAWDAEREGIASFWRAAAILAELSTVAKF